MRFLIFIILLLTAPKIFAQDSTDSAIITTNEVETTATDSASPSAQVESSPSATIEYIESSAQSSLPEKQVIEPDTETIIIYTGIMILILLAFFAGKKSSELSSNDN